MEERFQAAAKNCDCSIKFFREAKINDVPMKIATIEHSSVASSARFGLEKPQNSFEIGHETFSRPQQAAAAAGHPYWGGQESSNTRDKGSRVRKNNVLYIVSTVLVTE